MAWFGTHGYRKKITIDCTKVDSTLTDFTVPFLSVEDTDILANIGQADGGDIVFTADDGTTQLSHELEFYNQGTGTLECYVKIPSLSSTVDTVIYLYYGDAAIADQADPDNAWDSDFIIVNHGRVKTITTYNSLISGVQPSDMNGYTQVDNEVAGEFGSAIRNSHGDNLDYVRFADEAAIQISPDQTWEWIIKQDQFGENSYQCPGGKLYLKADGTDKSGIYNFIWADSGAYNGEWVAAAYDQELVSHLRAYCGSVVNYNTGYHYCVSMVQAGLVMGATDDQSDYATQVLTAGGSVAAIGNDLTIGRIQFRAPGEGGSVIYFTGDTSEVRFSSTVRSAAWRTTTYESMRNYSTFLTLGSEETEPVPGEGDTWYPHHPFPVPLGDRCKNTRYTDGGDIWWNVVDDFDQDTSWDIINEWDVDTSWDTVNDFDQDIAWAIQNEWLTTTSWDLLNDFSSGTSWDVLNDFDQDTSWDILNEWLQTTSWDSIKCFDNGTSWHIHPSQIEYIQNSGVHSVRFHFEVKRIATNFEAKDIDTNFEVAAVIDDNISVKPTGGLMEFNLKPVQYNFTVKYDLVHTFKITRVLDFSRDMR